VPIVDKEQRLVGIVTVDDIIDIIAEETTEDISKMAGIVTTDKPYLKTSSYKLWLARVPWLLLLMISSTFTGIIINSFEEALANALLFACVPMRFFFCGMQRI
jgi:magnesium transporter